MKCRRALCTLLVSAALMAGAVVYGQPRSKVQVPPMPAWKSPHPCDVRDGEVSRTICLARIRSTEFAKAWKSGVDEQGVQLDAAMRARKQTEMEVWLRRLRGSYRVEGTYSNSGGSQPVRGTANCLGVGDGSAAPCVITATWKAPKETIKDVELDRALYRALQGLVIMLGIDADASRIRVALMDYRAVRMSGYLIDGVAVFDGETTMYVFLPNPREPTPRNPLVPYFWNNLLVAANPDGEVVIKMKVAFADGEKFLSAPAMRSQQRNMAIEFDLHLHREPSPAPDR